MGNMDMNSLQAASTQQLMSAVYNAPTVVCKCGSKLFHEAVVLKKVSGLATGTGREELIPIPVYVCDKCGAIPEEFTSRSAAKKILGEDTEENKEESSILIK